MMVRDFSALAPRPGQVTHRRLVVPEPKWHQLGDFVAVMGGIGFGLVWIPAGLGMLVAAGDLPLRPVGGAVLAAAGFGAVVVAIVSGVTKRRWVRANSADVTMALPRLPQLAADNELDYVDVTHDIPFRHFFFRTKFQNPRLRWVLRSRTGRETVIGTFVVDIPQRRGAAFPLSRGFVAIRLDRSLPHVMLVPRSEFAPGVAREQALALEGDFYRYFTLYCAEGAERDALAVITPDVMAAMIDEAGLWTAEILDDWLVFSHRFSFGVFGLDDFRRVFDLADRAGGEFVEQTDRPGHPPVAIRGLPEAPAESAPTLARRVAASAVFNVAFLIAWAVLIFAVPAGVAFWGS